MNAPTLVDERACEEGRGDRRRSASLPSAGGAGRRGLRPRADGRPRAASRRTRSGAAKRGGMLVAGVDCSTQSTKVLLCDAADGTVVGRGSAPHPGGTECDPAAWWEALLQAGADLLDRAAAIGVAGQQHGMIVLDDAGQVIRPALLWNDLRSAAAAAELIGELGGRSWWAQTTGSVPMASFTVTKLRWLAEHEPANA